MQQRDIIIIGGGPGGYEIAAELAAKGRRVTLFERDRLGGTCLNRGCIPTKCLAASASTALHVKEASKFGINIGGDAVTVDYASIAARINDVTAALREGVASMLSQVEVINAEASLRPGPVIEAAGEEYRASMNIIATGSAPAKLDIPGANLALTSDEFLQLDSVPQRVVVIGGGVIGLEFASALAALGRDVTVIEYCKEVLPPFDADMAKRLRMALTRRGIKFLTGAAVRAIESGMRVVYEGKRGRDAVDCDMVLMAVGRRPVVPRGAVDAGIELDGRGFIKVNELMQTSVDTVYAVGDVNGLCMLAHAAAAQARRACGSDVNLDIIPSAVFTEPEAAMVGLTEAQARERDYDVVVGRASFASNGKALAMGEADGTVKMVFARDSGFMLGCHVIGPHASDLVAEAAAAMFGMLTMEEIADELVHSHPTLSEVLQTSARNALATAR